MLFSVSCIGELDIAQTQSAGATAETFHSFFSELLKASLGVLILEKGISFNGHTLSPVMYIDNPGVVRDEQFQKLIRIMQKGYRMAIIFRDPSAVMSILTSQGYEKTLTKTLGSKIIINNWVVWLRQNIRCKGCVLVVGHDWDPAFVFDVR